MLIMQKIMITMTNNDDNGDDNDYVDGHNDDDDGDGDGEPLIGGEDDGPPCDRLTASTIGELRRPRRTLLLVHSFTHCHLFLIIILFSLLQWHKSNLFNQTMQWYIVVTCKADVLRLMMMMMMVMVTMMTMMGMMMGKNLRLRGARNDTLIRL